MISKYPLLLAFVAIPNWTVETRTAACTGFHAAFLTGCLDSYQGKNLSDPQIKSIVNNCNDKAIVFSLKINICKDFEFTK